MKDTRAVQQIAQEQREHIIDSGIVRAVRGQYVDVLLDGTKKLVRDVILAKSITTINTGWWVVIARIPRTNKWVALVALESISTGSSAISSDLTAPASVTATAKPYLIELSWSGSFRDVATYEVQHNSSASETGATSLKVEGSNFFYWCAPGTQRYFRVRAVSSSFERSSWSGWVNATSTTGAAYMFLGLNAAGTAPIWTAFNWTNVSGVAGAAMAHSHQNNAGGGTLDHGLALTGLTDDDHTQYLKEKLSGGTGAEVPDHTHLAASGGELTALVELGFATATELTISGGSVTRTQVCHTIDTESDDVTDDLDTIAGGADGKLIVIRPANDARTVVVKHNAGNIWLSGRADISLDDAGDALILLYVNALSKWVDIGWSAGGGGGGAPTDAQYLVLALDGDLSAERRFVDGDGLQATDGGADGDYTLNIDAGDFAGTGLEDDGAENLRIAAAAAGDGLQGGAGAALAVDATVVRVADSITKTVGGGKDFATIQGAVDWFKNKIITGSCKIDVDAGSYDEAVVFTDIFCAGNGRLELEGDTRVLAGITYIDNGPGNRKALANGGGGTISLTRGGVGNVDLTVTGTGGNPDFDADGWVPGDKVLIYEAGVGITTVTLTGVLNNVLTQAAAWPALIGNEGSSITLLANRSITRAAAGPCIDVVATKGILLDGWHLDSASGADCHGLWVQMGGTCLCENVSANTEDYGFYCEDAGSIIIANDGACSAIGCTVGALSLYSNYIDLSYSAAVNCSLAGYFCARFGCIVADYAIGSYCAYAVFSYHFSHLKAVYAWITYCTDSYRAVYNAEVHAEQAAARNSTATGYYAEQMAYIFAFATNANNFGNLVDYSPAPAIPGSAQGNHFGVIYAS